MKYETQFLVLIIKVITAFYEMASSLKTYIMLNNLDHNWIRRENLMEKF